MCPTPQTLSLKRIGRGFHFVSSPRVLFVFAANLGSVEFCHSVFTLETPPLLLLHRRWRGRYLSKGQIGNTCCANANRREEPPSY